MAFAITYRDWHNALGPAYSGRAKEHRTGATSFVRSFFPILRTVAAENPHSSIFYLGLPLRNWAELWT